MEVAALQTMPCGPGEPSYLRGYTTEVKRKSQQDVHVLILDSRETAGIRRPRN